MIERARSSAAFIAEGPELWLPGALASLAFLGWLPFLLAVVGPPSQGDLAFFATALATSSAFPLNVVVFAAVVGFGGLTGSLLVASGEALLLGSIRSRLGRSPGDRTFDEELLRVWGAQLVAALPALLAAFVLGLGLAAVAPGEYQSPDIGGTILLRLAGDLWPLEVVLVVMVLVGQIYGAAAVRRVAGESPTTFPRALVAAWHDVIQRPWRLLGVAIVVAAVDATWLIGSWVLLHLLWTPIGGDLAGGRLTDPSAALLLVAFIAIWLCTLAIGGAAHAWSSVWWSLELGNPSGTIAQTQAGEAARLR
jgi:hypothetical protein